MEGPTYPIPIDFVAADKRTRKLQLNFAARNTKGIARSEVTLTVIKADNGKAKIVATLTKGSLLSAAIAANDPDGGPSPSNISYQWQSNLDGVWHDIEGATTATYTIPQRTTDTNQYRVKASYTDGQGYNTKIYSQAIKDIDTDDNGLIEISTLEQLNAIRYQLDGTGYKASTSATKITTGCPEDGCNGYELIRDLDFKDDASYSNATVNKKEWTVDNYDNTMDKGWQPIGMTGSFTSTFKGNNHTISNLMINRKGADNIGLFSKIRNKAEIRAEIKEVDLYNIKIVGHDHVGGLVGSNNGGSIMLSSVFGGTVTGNGGEIGGLVGLNRGSIMLSSVSDGTVTGEGDEIGGLVGSNSGTISKSYASINVSGTNPEMGTYVGGLVGLNEGQITASYAIGDVDGIATLGGLVGGNEYSARNEYSTIKNSYAIGMVSGTARVGGLIGLNDGTITDSYWDTETSGITTSADDMGKTTKDLQSPTTATGIYGQWSTANWDFGTEDQYPALKNNNGNLLAGQRLGLQSLDISNNVALIDTFGNTTYNYTVLVGSDAETIQITATAADSQAEITLSIGDSVITLSNGEPSSVDLAQDTSQITIMVRANKREVKYTLEVVRVVAKITRGSNPIPEMTSDPVTLKASMVDLRNISFDTTTWQWTQTKGNSLQTTATTEEITLTIPADYVEGKAETATATLKLKGVFTIEGKEVTSSAEIELTINKKDNGSLKPEDIGALVLKDATITVPNFRLSDIDGVNNPTAISYEWQQLISRDEWKTVSSTTMSNSYSVAKDTPDNTKYRVLIGYTDAQGYESTVPSSSITYVDIDRDNNGLIEIETKAELDAMRYQLNGSGYRKSADTDVDKITTGCPANKCNGYELKAHIDLGEYQNWQPIGDTANPFDAIFEGNSYTISNLSIETTATNVGLFGKTATNTTISNVGLLNVNIKVGENAGGLVGFNQGTISNSYVVGKVIGSQNVGSIVGINGPDGYFSDEAMIKNSYAIVTAGGANSSNVGGLAGKNNAVIKRSYVIAKQLVGTANVGGLIGIAGNQKSSQITDSYATVGQIKKGQSEGSSVCNLIGDNKGINKDNEMLGDCTHSTLFE